MTDIADWRTQAACKNADIHLFYPDPSDQAVEAKRICANCPVRAECLNHALTAPEQFGVWGCMTERERRTLLGRSRSTKGTVSRVRCEGPGCDQMVTVRQKPKEGRAVTCGGACRNRLYERRKADVDNERRVPA